MSDRDVLIAAAPGVDTAVLADWVRGQNGVADVVVTFTRIASPTRIIKHGRNLLK